MKPSKRVSLCKTHFLSLFVSIRSSRVKMAANMIPIGSARFRASAVCSHRNPDHRRERSYRNWWSPLFGYSAEADYVDSNSNKEDEKYDKIEGKIHSAPAADKSGRFAQAADKSGRFAPGGFTEEKARHLRLLTADTSSFHEVMYHSAIASRLASDFSNSKQD